MQVHKHDELMPKFVCTHCWTKLANFHEFYTAVDAAKHIYLGKFVKEEVPNFIEINCDGFAENFPPVKDEPTINSKLLPVVHFNDNSEELGDSIESIAINTRDAEHIECDEEAIRDNYDSVMYEVTEQESTAIDDVDDMPHSPKMEVVDEETVQTLNIRCGLCGRSVCKSSEAVNHYRSEHGEHAPHRQIIKCCDRQLLPYDIRDHTRYHLNPDSFK